MHWRCKIEATYAFRFNGSSSIRGMFKKPPQGTDSLSEKFHLFRVETKKDLRVSIRLLKLNLSDLNYWSSAEKQETCVY